MEIDRDRETEQRVLSVRLNQTHMNHNKTRGKDSTDQWVSTKRKTEAIYYAGSSELC